MCNSAGTVRPNCFIHFNVLENPSFVILYHKFSNAYMCRLKMSTILKGSVVSSSRTIIMNICRLISSFLCLADKIRMCSSNCRSMAKSELLQASSGLELSYAF